MPSTEDPRAALEALETCRSTLQRLEARCCEPDRSPRMVALGATLDRARMEITRIATDPGTALAALVTLEDAGGQVGALQVGCCAPGRLPLYADILRELTAARLAVSGSVGAGH